MSEIENQSIKQEEPLMLAKPSIEAVPPTVAKKCAWGEGVLLACVVFALIVFGVLLYCDHAKQRTLDKRLKVLIAKNQADHSMMTKDLIDQRKLLAQTKESLHAQIVENSDKLHRLSDRYDWPIQEALYLVSIAQERLNTVGDLKTALKQLKMAQSRLRQIADARTIEIRGSIAKDILRLEDKAQFDKVGLWLTVGNLRKLLEKLTFHSLQASIEGQPELEAPETPLPTSLWRQALVKTWQELKGLIKVRDFNSDKLVSSIEPKEQIQILRSMDLVLGETQWAVLQEEPIVYATSLHLIEEKLTYFIQNEEWHRFQNQVIELKKQVIQPEKVDLSDTLQLMHKFVAYKEQV